jgi:hypothetical protein
MGVILLIPIFTSFYLKGLSELNSFLVSHSNTKQQRLVLEIFDRQNQGVVLLKQHHKGNAP